MKILSNRELVAGYASGIVLAITSIAVAIVQLRLILEYLPREIAGIWIVFLSLGAYIAFFDLGLSPTLSREISFSIANKNVSPNNAAQYTADLLATCLRALSFLALVVFLLGFFGGGLLLQHVSPSDRVREVEIAWIIFVSGAAINVLGGGMFASLYGLGDVTIERIIRAGIQLLGLSISYLCLYAGFGIIGLACAWVLQNVLGRLYGTFLLYSRHPWLKALKGNAQASIFRKIASPSLKWAAMGLGALLMFQTDKIIIATFLGPGVIPQYEAVAKIALTLMTFSLIIVSTTTPELSKAHAAKDSLRVRTLLLRNIRVSMATIVTFGAFLAIFGKEVIDIWLGPGNFAGNAILWTLLVMVFLEVHHSALAAGTMATGRLDFVWIAIGAGLLNVCFGLLLVQPLGLWGVALGTMFSQLLTNNWYAPMVTFRHFSLSVKVYACAVVIPVLLVLFCSLVANVVIRLLFSETSTRLSLGAAFVASVLLSSAAGYRLILTSEERTAIRAFAKLGT